MISFPWHPIPTTDWTLMLSLIHLKSKFISLNSTMELFTGGGHNSISEPSWVSFCLDDWAVELNSCREPSSIMKKWTSVVRTAAMDVETGLTGSPPHRWKERCSIYSWWVRGWRTTQTGDIADGIETVCSTLFNKGDTVTVLQSYLKCPDMFSKYFFNWKMSSILFKKLRGLFFKVFPWNFHVCVQCILVIPTPYFSRQLPPNLPIITSCSPFIWLCVYLCNPFSPISAAHVLMGGMSLL